MAITKQKPKSGRKRASASSPIPKTILEKVQNSLTTLPEKPKEEVPLREALEQMQEVIVEALAKGYNHEDVASLLTQAGVALNAPSLKYHLLTLKKQKKRKGTKTTRGGRPKEDAKSNSAAVDIASSSSEVPAKKPTRTKAPAKTPSKRAVAKTKPTAAESSVAVDPTPAPAAEGAKPSTKKRGTRGTTKSAASTATPSVTAPKAAPKTSSSRSRKK